MAGRWSSTGREDYPHTGRLLITADAGGSNGYRRLFSHISMNWRGRPLASHEVIVQSIAATTTTTGLRVQAHLDTGSYPTGLSVNDADTSRPCRTHC